MPGFVFSSTLALPLADASARLLRPPAVNAELGPWLRMTMPAPWGERPLPDWPVGRPLFRSVILLLGVLPLDLHHFRLEATGEAGFYERSSSLVMRSWRHKRLLRAAPGGTLVEDRVVFACRLPGLGSLLAPVYRAVFRHRHCRLRRWYAQVGKQAP